MDSRLISTSMPGIFPIVRNFKLPWLPQRRRETLSQIYNWHAKAGWQRPLGYNGSPVQHKCKGKQHNKGTLIQRGTARLPNDHKQTCLSHATGQIPRSIVYVMQLGRFPGRMSVSCNWTDSQVKCLCCATGQIVRPNTHKTMVNKYGSRAKATMHKRPYRACKQWCTSSSNTVLSS